VHELEDQFVMDHDCRLRIRYLWVVAESSAWRHISHAIQ